MIKIVLTTTLFTITQILSFLIHQMLFGCEALSLVWLYDIPTIVGYLMPNPFYTNKQLFFKQFSLA